MKREFNVTGLVCMLCEVRKELILNNYTKSSAMLEKALETLLHEHSNEAISTGNYPADRDYLSRLVGLRW